MRKKLIKLLINALFGQGSTLLRQNKIAESAQYYRELGLRLKKIPKQQYLTLEAFTISSYCFFHLHQRQTAWLSAFHGLVVGLSLTAEQRQHVEFSRLKTLAQWLLDYLPDQHVAYPSLEKTLIALFGQNWKHLLSTHTPAILPENKVFPAYFAQLAHDWMAQRSSKKPTLDLPMTLLVVLDNGNIALIEYLLPVKQQDTLQQNMSQPLAIPPKSRGKYPSKRKTDIKALKK